MQFILKVNTDNAAFGEDMYDIESELVSILHQAIDKLQAGNVRFPLKDSNGNTVGTAGIETGE